MQHSGEGGYFFILYYNHIEAYPQIIQYDTMALLKKVRMYPPNTLQFTVHNVHFYNRIILQLQMQTVNFRKSLLFSFKGWP